MWLYANWFEPGTSRQIRSGTMNENPSVRPPSRHSLRPLIAASILLIAVLVAIAGYLEKWLWMQQLDYTGIFWTLLSVQWRMFCSAFVVAFLFLWINLRQATKNGADFQRIRSGMEG
jgi:hypothetical protein